MVCKKCNIDHDRTYKKQNLCFYHYWIERGRPKDKFSLQYWNEYRYLHPVRVSRWCKQDNDLNVFLSGASSTSSPTSAKIGGI